MPMTLRQRFHFGRLMWKKTRELGRRPNESELREVLAIVLDEFNLLLRAIGGVAIAWAEVEFSLDYINGILIMHRDIAEKELPKSLKPKIGFFKKSFDRIQELAPLREKALRLLSELNRLKNIRHDVIHGVAFERTPVAIRKVMRVDYKGKELSERYETYSIADIGYAASDMVTLKNELLTLFKDILWILHPEQAKQAFG